MKKIFTRVTVIMLSLIILVSPVLGTSTSEPAPVSNPTEPTPSAVKAALKEFKSLSKKERKSRVKEAKRELKKFKAEKRNGKEPSTNTVLLVILAILLPPLAVYLHEGEINNKFWISLILTLLFWIPGVIYALIVVLGND